MKHSGDLDLLRNIFMLAALFVSGCAANEQVKPLTQVSARVPRLSDNVVTTQATCGPTAAREFGLGYARRNAPYLGPAFERNRVAALDGNLEAQLYLGKAYYFGWGVAPE